MVGQLTDIGCARAQEEDFLPMLNEMLQRALGYRQDIRKYHGTLEKGLQDLHERSCDYALVSGPFMVTGEKPCLQPFAQTLADHLLSKKQHRRDPLLGFRSSPELDQLLLRTFQRKGDQGMYD